MCLNGDSLVVTRKCPYREEACANALAGASDSEWNRLVMGLIDLAQSFSNTLRREIRNLKAQEVEGTFPHLVRWRRERLEQRWGKIAKVTKGIAKMRALRPSPPGEACSAFEGGDPSRRKASLLLQEALRVDEDRLDQIARQARWPTGFQCQNCRFRAGTWVRSRRSFRCGRCGRFEALLRGSVMSRSHLELRIWVAATITLFGNREISPQGLALQLGIRRVATARRLKRQIGSLSAQLDPNLEHLTLEKVVQHLLGMALVQQASRIGKE